MARDVLVKKSIYSPPDSMSFSFIVTGKLGKIVIQGGENLMAGQGKVYSCFYGASRSNQRGRRIDEQRHVLLLDESSRGQRWIWLRTDFLIRDLMDF